MRQKAHTLMKQYNQVSFTDSKQRADFFKKWFGKVGKNCFIEPNFRCDYGINIEIGDNFYANFDYIILNCAKVMIVNNVIFGPRVNLFTTGHPLDAEILNFGLEITHPIIIKDNVLLGGNVTFLSGVTIGKNSVVVQELLLLKMFLKIHMIPFRTYAIIFYIHTYIYFHHLFFNKQLNFIKSALFVNPFK